MPRQATKSEQLKRRILNTLYGYGEPVVATYLSSHTRLAAQLRAYQQLLRIADSLENIRPYSPRGLAVSGILRGAEARAAHFGEEAFPFSESQIRSLVAYLYSNLPLGLESGRTPESVGLDPSELLPDTDTESAMEFASRVR